MFDQAHHANQQGAAQTARTPPTKPARTSHAGRPAVIGPMTRKLLEQSRRPSGPRPGTSGAGDDAASIPAEGNAPPSGAVVVAPISMADLSVIQGDEPRVHAELLADRIGFGRTRRIRELIERHRSEIESYGEIDMGLTPRQEKHRLSQGLIPSFKIGRTVCASKSRLDDWIAEQYSIASGVA